MCGLNSFFMYKNFYCVSIKPVRKLFSISTKEIKKLIQNRDINYPVKKDSLFELVNSIEETDDYVSMLVE